VGLLDSISSIDHLAASGVGLALAWASWQMVRERGAGPIAPPAMGPQSS